ncbi:hypothetical protein HY68_01270 [Streptomyces sp. AcH 505]|uniref:DUF3846 domain-containing protein n=1 Tax=Streptomyces sp. AcH 505 TaxID=352211 RepID=UPI000591FBD4|nr:hypothetical protein HY68_01270 [Streptomyces sp. AcH 505]
MADTFAGLRVDTAGVCTGVQISRARYLDELPAMVGGPIEFAHYGTAESAITVIVHETGLTDGLPINRLVTVAAAMLRGGPLRYPLHGPIVVLGAAQRTLDLTDLTESQRTFLLNLPAALAKVGEAL